MSRKITLENQVEEMYVKYGKEDIYSHVLAVANLSEKIASKYTRDSNKCRIAALLHDISTVISPEEMYHLIITKKQKIELSEERYPFLLHQRVSAIMANEIFQVEDEEVLSAIACHTTLKSNASSYDKVLFIADKLSWKQDGMESCFNLVLEELTKSLDHACYAFIDYQLKNELLLYPHSWLIEAHSDLNKTLLE